MSRCKFRIMDNCKKFGRPCDFSKECFDPEQEKKPTNADRIRNMSDEELVEFLYKIENDGFPEEFCNKQCILRNECPVVLEDGDCPYNTNYVNGYVAWLQSEAESEVKNE